MKARVFQDVQSVSIGVSIQFLAALIEKLPDSFLEVPVGMRRQDARTVVNARPARKSPSSRARRKIRLVLIEDEVFEDKVGAVVQVAGFLIVALRQRKELH